MEKQGKKIEELLRLVRRILDEQPLPARHRDHAPDGSGLAGVPHQTRLAVDLSDDGNRGDFRPYRVTRRIV